MSKEIDDATKNTIDEIFDKIAGPQSDETWSFLRKQSDREKISDEDKLRENKDWEEIINVWWRAKESFKKAHDNLDLNKMIKKLQTMISCFTELIEVAEDEEASTMKGKLEKLRPSLVDAYDELENIKKSLK